MGRSLRLTTIRGIDVRMHLTFPLILIWAALNWGAQSFHPLTGAIYGVVLVLLLFVCVVLHELGHSMVAMHFGVRVRDIILLPIGGVAQLRRMPSRPRQELLVALAGPAVNVAIAVVLGFGLLSVLGGQVPSIFRLLRLALQPGPLGVLVYLLLANAGMALFNMIPAFPMDGGRVLRALLAMGFGNLRATVIAARAGQAVAALFAAGAIYSLSPLLLIVAIFIFMGAGGELRGAKLRSALDGITAGQAIDPLTVPALNPDQPLGSVTQAAILYREPDFPVMRDGRLLGILRSSELNAAMREHGPWAPISAAMKTMPLAAKATDSLYDIEQLLADSDGDAVGISDENGFFRGILTRQRIWAATRGAGN